MGERPFDELDSLGIFEGDESNQRVSPRELPAGRLELSPEEIEEAVGRGEKKCTQTYGR
jgi:hypothetical protein